MGFNIVKKFLKAEFISTVIFIAIMCLIFLFWKGEKTIMFYILAIYSSISLSEDLTQIFVKKLK
ncbi:Uncharacterised protein [Streptococcus macacae NCTC 11558]|uniref:Uncharacterized protein n=1 Tax=Streptococcus macacae NCTC 11558 TaxID=764298 RepID=G5JXF2_9STRE|nr:hypothetical protein STRMA_1308 [Streptococcus macacae NCTC 11558]SUN79211.1 Uncharacterised protein [Streptococcus macacae NCTC 11558]